MSLAEGDTLSSLEESGCNLRLLAEICHELREIQSGEFLDVGCGTGVFAEYLERATGLFAYGTEISEHAWRIASRRIKCYHVSGINLPFESGKFDLVVAINVIMMISSKKHWFEEIFRVLRSGGKFITVMPDGIDYFQKPLYSFIPGSRDSSMSMYGLLDDALNKMRMAGFRRVETRRVSLGTVELGDRYFRRHQSGYFSNSEAPELTVGRLAGLAKFAAFARASSAMGIRMHYDWERTLLVGEKA